MTDSLNNKTFNVTVTVTGKTKLSNGQPAYIWTYQYPDRLGTQYVLDTQDSVIFYGNTEVIDSTKIDILDVYHFPLTVGAKWKVSSIRDTSTVVSLSPFNMNGKTYNDTYLIHEYGRGYNYSISKNIWIEPNVGLIRIDHNSQEEFDSWQLISYSLK